MAKKKETTLIEGNIACNKICKAIKDKGLPHNSIWLYINHLVHNLDADPNLTAHQRQVIVDLCDEYLAIIQDLSSPAAIHQQGLHLLAEIRAIEQTKIRRRVQDEEKFSAELLATIRKNLEKFYAIFDDQDPSTTIGHFKEKTLQAIQKTSDKASILAIIEDSFDTISAAVQKNMTTIRDSLDSMLDLESKALIDPLTGIFNRRFFDQELPKIVHTFLELEGKKPFSMLVLDIDNFKEVNDQYGHFVGDYALQRVAEILQKNCRAGIDAPIRLGGDEFALFLIGAHRDAATRKAQIIREQVAANQIHFSKHNTSGPATDISFPITVSIGVSALRYCWKDVEALELIGSSLVCNPNNLEPHYKLTCKISESADEALYTAKDKGKNRVSVYDRP